MPCYHPLPGWRAKRPNQKTGSRPIVFNFNDAYKDLQVDVPCGRCIGCRLERSRQWATRCQHEASLWPHNCFITLTYNDGALRSSIDEQEGFASLRPRDFTTFMKRLRWKYGPNIRFFHCGEYGEKLSRPHHHALLFNHDFNDKRKLSGNGINQLYESDQLNELWPHGFASIGAVTWESAAYVARYALKKINGPGAEEHYQGRVPEYLTMSRRPGIGAGWLEKWSSDVYPSDIVIVRGTKTKPPRYYDEKYVGGDVRGKDNTEKETGENLTKSNGRSKVRDNTERVKVMRKVKGKRKREGKNNNNNTGARLLVRETVKEAQAQQLKRQLETPD